MISACVNGCGWGDIVGYFDVRTGESLEMVVVVTLELDHWLVRHMGEEL